MTIRKKRTQAETFWEKVRAVIPAVLLLVVSCALFYAGLYLVYLIAVAAAKGYLGK